MVQVSNEDFTIPIWLFKKKKKNLLLGCVNIYLVFVIGYKSRSGFVRKSQMSMVSHIDIYVSITCFL